MPGSASIEAERTDDIEGGIRRKRRHTCADEAGTVDRRNCLRAGLVSRYIVAEENIGRAGYVPKCRDPSRLIVDAIGALAGVRASGVDDFHPTILLAGADVQLECKRVFSERHTATEVEVSLAI